MLRVGCLMFDEQNLKSQGGDVWCRQKEWRWFLCCPKITTSSPPAREQSDAKNCRHSPRDQMSVQKAKWTWHGRANIYTGGGFYMSKLFMGTQPPHLAMYLFPTPIPSPFHPNQPFHFTSLPPSKKPGRCTPWRPSSLIYCTYNCKTRALGKT